jgi:hypothetical protein
MVQSDDDEQKLAYYGTLAYKAAPCLITFTDGVQQVQQWGGHSYMPEMQRL